MATYTDLSRTSRQDATYIFTNIKSRRWQPMKVIPPGQYLHHTDVDFTIGDHFSNYARLQLIYNETNTGVAGSPWNVYVYARITVWCGATGIATTTSDVLVFSQTAIPSTQDYYDVSIASISGTFAFTIGSDIKYDINETATTVLDLPKYTTYKQYERSQIGSTASCSLSCNGTTVTNSGTVSVAQTTNYKFRCDVTSFQKSGALASLSELKVQTCTTNSIAIPDYNHQNVLNAQYYAKHNGSQILFANVGTDDAFGDPASTTITMSSRVKLKTYLKSLGKINAFDITYPQSLNVQITGFNNTNPGTTGTRNITPTGSWEENDTWDEYDISSTVGATTVATGPYDNSGNTFKTVITGGLTTNGDDGKYTRLYLRGWNFPGANMSLANETEVVGGTGNSRSYAGNGQYFNSYRYLELEVKSNTGTLQNDTLTLTTQPNSISKTYAFNVTSSTYVRVRIDLLCPNNGILGIDDQDDPYPRKHPTDNTYASQERQNKDWYGVTRVSALSIANANITLNRIYLVADAQSTQSNYCHPPEYYVKVQNDSNTGTTYLGRRHWTQDTAGRSEEEYDVLNTAGTKAMTTIADFVSRVNNNHPGWTASTSTASGTGLNAYKNSISGYSCWLGGITWKADTGSGTIQKDWFNVVQNAGEPDCNTLAQTIFDELDTSELIPDYSDPFGVYKQASPPLITIPSAAILRSQAHGQVINSTYTGANNEVVNLLLAVDNSNRGSGTTNIIGNYYTGFPRGLSYKNHITEYTAGAQQKAWSPMYAAKRYRTTFYPQIIIGGCLSADKSPIYTHAFCQVDSGALKLYLTGQPTPTSYYVQVVPITNVSCAAMKYTTVFNAHRILFIVKHTDNSIKRYYTDDDGESVSMAITLGTGSSPAVCCDNSGLEYYFWRTSAGDLYRAVYDAQGNSFIAASAIVTATCQDKGIGCYERLGKVIVVYSDSATGLKQLSSSNDGETFA